MITPEIIVREYNPETGVLIGNVSSFTFGKVIRGAHTRVKVIDIAFLGASNVSNLHLGLVGDAGITASSPNLNGITNNDGSVSNGFFGITTTTQFDSSISSSPLLWHFPGLNANGLADNANNVSIGTRAANISNYIYLDIEVGSANTGLSNGAYQIFFDFT
jgi:hypothetical protein